MEDDEQHAEEMVAEWAAGGEERHWEAGEESVAPQGDFEEGGDDGGYYVEQDGELEYDEEEAEDYEALHLTPEEAEVAVSRGGLRCG